jgi:hypothetical protein
MTRENKAGIVVSCSFLCLVGAVLWSKLQEKPAARGVAMSILNGANADNKETQARNLARVITIRDRHQRQVSALRPPASQLGRVRAQHHLLLPVDPPLVAVLVRASKSQASIPARRSTPRGQPLSRDHRTTLTPRRPRLRFHPTRARALVVLPNRSGNLENRPAAGLRIRKRRR